MRILSKTPSLPALLLAVIALIGTAAPAAAQERSQEERFIDLMQAYLGVSDKWLELAGTQEAAVFFAIEGIVEIYEQQGRRRDAIPHLRDVLERHSGNPTVRTITRFKLRDLYKETGQPDLALEELDTIIDENR